MSWRAKGYCGASRIKTVIFVLLPCREILAAMNIAFGVSFVEHLFAR